MNAMKLPITLTIALLTLAQAQAFEPFAWLSGHTRCRPNCVGKFCCDDYDGKPLPCAVGANCFECADYCAKPRPCLPAGNSFCCDDFCPKPLPPICCANAKQLRCVPNRLPPIGPSTPKQATLSERVGVQVIPVTSSRRVPDEDHLAVP